MKWAATDLMMIMREDRGKVEDESLARMYNQSPVESAPAEGGLHCEAVGNTHLPYLHSPCGQLATLNFELAASKAEALSRLRRNRRRWRREGGKKRRSGGGGEREREKVF